MDRGEKIQLARDFSDELCAHFGETVAATGLYGSVARREDGEMSDVDIAVVLTDPTLAASRVVLYGPVIMDVEVTSPEDYLRGASTVDPSWPVRADRYVNSLPLHDPNDFFKQLRHNHDALLAGPVDAFARAAGTSLARAIDWTYKARAALGPNDSFASVAVGEAAEASVMTIGLMARFAFKNLAHALFVAPRLPGVPPKFEEPFRAALAPVSFAEDAVKAIEDAVEVLLSDALARDIPFAGEGAQDFLW